LENIMIKKRLWALALLAMSTGVAPAQAETLEVYTQRLAEHPQVTTILEQSTRLRELSDAEMSLPDPQLIVGIDNMPIEDPAFDRFLPTAKVFGFRQQIPSYELREALSAKQETLSERQKLLADYTKQRLRAILISQIIQLDTVTALEKLAKRQLGYYRSMEDDLKGQLEAGNPVYGRFSEIDVERTDLEQRLNDLKAERVAVEEELIRLVGEVPELTIPVQADITWQREADRLYPIRIANQEVHAASSDVEAADAAFNPNYGVQAVYKQRESGSNFRGDDWFSVQATISIPLWYESNQKPRLRAAEAGKRSAEFALEDAKRDWIKRMAALKAERDIAADNIELLEEKKAALRQMVKAANRNYESGNAPLETVLDAQIDELTIASQLASMKSRHIRLSAEFNSHIIGGDHEIN
jgi:outer membrane protein TolC